MVCLYAPISADGASLREYCMRRGWEDFAVLSDADVLLRAVRAGKVESVLASNLNVRAIKKGGHPFVGLRPLLKS